MNGFYEEIQQRTALNFQRLSSEKYNCENIFQPKDYGWEGDYEGRALLAFVCHYIISGKKIATMDYIIENIEQKTNKYNYFGNVFDGNIISEQLLSGNSWFLRGLCEYYNAFKDENVLSYINNIVNNLYLKLENFYKNYPIEREIIDKGDVSGEIVKTIDGWRLSSDIGCAFIAIDGLTHAYEITKNEDLANFIKIIIEKFMTIDLLKLKCQTHATLTAARGIFRFYKLVQDKKYFNYAKSIFEIYVKNGMTYNYENYNWFNRGNTWTEPCAVVDSFILAINLYNETKQESYLRFAKRIYLNGLNFCFRSNGGAGTNTCVDENQKYLKVSEIYEAHFCCTMRYAEGLKYINEYKNILYENYEDCKIVKDKQGRFFKGDMLLYLDEDKFLNIPKAYKISEEELKKLNFKII